MNLIDTHCHIDLYKNPHDIAEESERLGIITIGMTLLPSHFELGYKHVQHYKKVRLALGMHPLKAEFHENEFNDFVRYLEHTSYIGEIGLDYSREGVTTKEIQLKSFHKILESLRGKKKILNLHSRKAENDVLNSLIEYEIKNAIFHWYTGPVKLVDQIAKNGFYFSVNPSMLRSQNGISIIQAIPKQRLLTESDGPFAMIGPNPVKPKDVQLVITYLTKAWKMQVNEVSKQINDNFSQLINTIRY